MDSTKQILDPNVIGQEHHDCARRVQGVLQRYKELQDIIAILEWMNCSKTTSSVSQEQERLSIFLPQPFFVAETFTGAPGKYVQLSETIKGFNGIVNKIMMIFLSTFYMVGSIEEAEKAKPHSE